MKKKINDLFSAFQLPSTPDPGIGNIALYERPFNGRKLIVKKMLWALHGTVLCNWSNQPYTAKYWQMQGSPAQLKAYYEKEGRKQHYFFMVYLDGVPVAFTDIYRISHDELARHIPAGAEDYGIHILMCPYRQLPPSLLKTAKGISYESLLTILDFLFHILGVGTVYAEPDASNIPACRLAEKAGFHFLKNIAMSYKQAALYQYAKEDYFLRHPPVIRHPGNQ